VAGVERFELFEQRGGLAIVKFGHLPTRDFVEGPSVEGRFEIGPLGKRELLDLVPLGFGRFRGSGELGLATATPASARKSVNAIFFIKRKREALRRSC